VQDSLNKDWMAKVYLEVLCSDKQLTLFKTYCKDRATTFHHFLLAILVGYACALLRLQMAIGGSEKVFLKHQKSRKEGDQRDSPASHLDEEVLYQVEAVTMFAHACTLIAHSHALEEHLQVLSQHTLWSPMV